MEKTLDIQIEWRGLTPQTQKRVGKLVRGSLTDFFKGYDQTPISRIQLIGFAAERGANGDQLVKVIGPRKEFGNHPEMVPVNVHLEGTQGLIALCSIDQLPVGMIKELIERGPYRKRKQSKLTPCQPVTATPDAVVEEKVVLETVSAPAPSEATCVTVPATVESEVIPQQPVVPRLSPREKLERNEVPADEIGRLAVTLASIVQREMVVQKLAEVPNTLRVSVNSITRAIMEHMKLSYNDAGNYRGTIANFYTTRIALFALKYEDALDENDRYTDWLFDCSLVLDFIGGKNQLAALTRVREVEVEERLREEAKPKAEPVPAAKVEEAVREGFLPDNSIFELAVQTLAARKEAEEALARARENEVGIENQMLDLQLRLKALQDELACAKMLTLKARDAVASYTIPEDVLRRVREAKARLDTLARDLGL